MFNKKKDQPPKLFCKRMFLKISQISQQNTVLDCVINKVASRPATLLKTDSNTGAFLSNLRNF